MKLTIACPIVYILLVSICEAQMTQSDSTFLFEPIGEEGYLALVQFLDYDKGLPLNEWPLKNSAVVPQRLTEGELPVLAEFLRCFRYFLGVRMAHSPLKKWPPE